MNEKEQSPDDASRTAVESGSDMHDEKTAERRPTTPPQSDLQIYDEGGNIIIENQDDDVIVLKKTESRGRQTADATKAAATEAAQEAVQAARGESSWSSFKRVVGDAYTSEMEKRKAKSHEERKHEPARAYQFGNTIVIEDEDGEVIKTYDLPVQKPEKEGPDLLQQCQKYLGIPVAKTNSKTAQSGDERPTEEGESSQAGPSRPAYRGWTSFLGGPKGDAAQKDKGPATGLVDDKQVRFTIGGEGRRLNKDDFLKEVQNLDPKARREAIETATLPQAVKKTEIRKAAAKAPPAVPVPEIREHRASDEIEERERAPAREPEREPEPAKPMAPPVMTPAAVARVSRQDEGDHETPAERRRREAALGSSGANDDDSDDEGGERVPPSRRGIRFADNVGHRRE